MGDLIQDGYRAKVDLFLSMPVFLYGLTRVLDQRGLSVVGAKMSTSEGLSPRSDVVVVDIEALHDGDPARLVAAVGDTVPVVLLVDDADGGSSRRYLEAGIRAVVSLQSSVHVVVESVHLAIFSERSNRAGVPGGGHEAASSDTAHALNRLSKREQQVLWQVARGLTHGQIARTLGISQHTVDTHVKRIKSKLTVGTKAALVKAALLGGETGPVSPLMGTRQDTSWVAHSPGIAMRGDDVRRDEAGVRSSDIESIRLESLEVGARRSRPDRSGDRRRRPRHVRPTRRPRRPDRGGSDLDGRAGRSGHLDGPP